MAFTVETGEGSALSNAYTDVAFFDAYHADRGHARAVGLSGPVKEAAIVRATDYVDKRFGRRFRGRKKNPSQQALMFPRVDLYDKYNDLICASNEIPHQLKQAIAEYALRAAIIGELAPDPMSNVPRQDLSDPTYTPPTEFTGGQVRRIAKKVDVIETAKTFNTAPDLTVVSRPKMVPNSLVTDANIPEYPAADMLLEELIASGSRRIRRA